MHKYMEEDEDI